MGLLNKKLSDWTANDVVDVYLAKEMVEGTALVAAKIFLPSEEIETLRSSIHCGAVPEGGWEQYKHLEKYLRYETVQDPWLAGRLKKDEWPDWLLQKRPESTSSTFVGWAVAYFILAIIAIGLFAKYAL